MVVAQQGEAMTDLRERAEAVAFDFITLPEFVPADVLELELKRHNLADAIAAFARDEIRRSDTAKDREIALLRLALVEARQWICAHEQNEFGETPILEQIDAAIGPAALGEPQEPK